MPLINSFRNNIYIWKNTESVIELEAKIKNIEQHQEKLNLYKSIARKKQFLTTRLLLQEVFGTYQLKKGNNNKPYLHHSELEISFTHNKEFTILMTSKNSCGIDIQTPSETTVRVKQKFMNENDLFFNSNDYLLLSEIWSCKEAAFKKFGENEIFLKENITVSHKSKDNIFEVQVHFNKENHQVLLKLEKLENNYVLYTLN